MKVAAILAAAALALPADAATQRARYLMGTVCEIEADDAAQIDRAFDEAKRIETMLSTWSETSELSRVNRGEIEPSDELNALLAKTLVWSQRTNRAFDPRLGHLVARFRSASARCDSDGRAAALHPPFEEGAFGKGYALDRMLALIDGEALINFGGQIVVRGERAVSVADPDGRDTPVLALTIADASLSTSSGGHILDPRTGEPLPDRGSASVIANDALTADILSTALYVMGPEEGLRWAAATDVAVIFIDTNRIIRLSPAARARVRGLAVLDRNFSLKD